MKSQMVCDRQKNWSEEGKTGRLLILYVGLVISSYVRYIWKTTQLHDMFPSSLELLDEMRLIRCIEHTSRTKFVTPFIGTQAGISTAFGFKVPNGCLSDYVSRQETGKKCGRPRKKTVEIDY